MSEKEWVAIIGDCRASGMSAKIWCETNGYKYTSYCYWTTRINKQKRQWGQVVAVQNVPAVTNEIRLQFGKCTVVVAEGFPPKLLADVLQVVNSVCC